VSEHVKSCKGLLDQNQLKEAATQCQKALDLDPRNTEAKEVQTLAQRKLRSEMKAIYEQAILEESYGNVEAAKEKWREIIKSSLPGEEYYNKSKSKLRKYGVF
jgi:tetratricopeptide (TPR) repeat protein